MKRKIRGRSCRLATQDNSKIKIDGSNGKHNFYIQKSFVAVKESNWVLSGTAFLAMKGKTCVKELIRAPIYDVVTLLVYSSASFMLASNYQVLRQHYCLLPGSWSTHSRTGLHASDLVQKFLMLISKETRRVSLTEWVKHIKSLEESTMKEKPYNVLQEMAPFVCKRKPFLVWAYDCYLQVVLHM